MKRLAAIIAAGVLVTAMAWRASSAGADEAAPAVDSTTVDTVEAASSTEPALPPSAAVASSTTSTSLEATTTVESAMSTVAAESTTSIPAPTTSTPSTPTSTSTTTTSPATTTTTMPTTTTTMTTVAATTTVPVESATTTTTTTIPISTTAAEELESSPAPPPPAPTEGGRTVESTGIVDTGQVRPIVFPVAGPVTYGNDFGVCRDRCSRRHRGIDVIGDRLQPLVAMHSGVIDRLLDHPTAGYGIVVRDEEGWEYHLYHLNNDTPGTDDGADDGSWRFAAGIAVDARVAAGQLIGWIGDSGNSEGSVPHAHVEIHAPGGQAINPFWSLQLAQRDATCARAAAVPGGVADETAPDPAWLAATWSAAVLPQGWTPVGLSGGRPRSGAIAARMWISPDGFTPVDAAALQVGDPRYDATTDCARAPAPPVVAASSDLGPILATIRAMETGGDYTVQVRTSTASGAYGFLDSSWGRYGGYARARDAPPVVQDAKAAELATSILRRNGGDVSTIPVSWYIGHVPVGGEWDVVPPYPGNTLTPRQYQERWMRRYAAMLGSPGAWVATGSWTPLDTTATCRTVLVDVGSPEDPQYALTQARVAGFVPDAAGRAVLGMDDPCDPDRDVAAVAAESTVPPP